jgi:hypothetical protein
MFYGMFYGEFRTDLSPVPTYWLVRNGNSGRQRLPNIPRMAEPKKTYKHIAIRQIEPAGIPMMSKIVLNSFEWKKSLAARSVILSSGGGVR